MSLFRLFCVNIVLQRSLIPLTQIFVVVVDVTVNFPVKDMELRDYIPSLPTAAEGEKTCTKYNLIANVVHDGKPEDGYFRVFVQRKSQELW